MSLEVDVRHRLDRFELAVRFASDGPLTALFGRSGAGKTTVVNMIAGLLRPTDGRIAIGGSALFDRAKGIDVPPHRRRVGYVFQEGRLFPHLTARQNLGYGRWFTPAGERYGDFDHVVDLLGLGGLLDRRPQDLSGGEKQRVAIGRALLASPRLLLMDEPLAALDNRRKDEILPYIERLRDEIRVPIVYVSHAVSEVARLATTVVVLSEGKVEAAGAAADVLTRLDLFPLTGRYEAAAILDARVASHDNEYALTTLQCRAGALVVPRVDFPAGTPLRVRIRARDVLIATSRPQDLSAQNVLPGTIAEIGGGAGPIVDLRLDCQGETVLARVTRKSLRTLGLAPGRPVFAVIKTIAFDRKSLGLTAPAADGGDGDAD
jgi:molybdate transport system ATP-binding protein